MKLIISKLEGIIGVCFNLYVNQTVSLISRHFYKMKIYIHVTSEMPHNECFTRGLNYIQHKLIFGTICTTTLNLKRHSF